MHNPEGEGRRKDKLDFIFCSKEVDFTFYSKGGAATGITASQTHREQVTLGFPFSVVIMHCSLDSAQNSFLSSLPTGQMQFCGPHSFSGFLHRHFPTENLIGT